MDAFEVHAIDYLLKPVEEERPVLALERSAWQGRAAVANRQGKVIGDDR